MKRIIKSYFNSLAVYVLVGLFIVLINLAWFIPTTRTMRHQISENQLEIIKRSQAEITFFLDSQINALAQYALFLDPHLNAEGNREVVAKVLHEPYLDKVSLLDASGQEVFRADRLAVVFQEAMENRSKNPEFVTVIGTQKPFFSDIRFAETLEPITSIAVPVSFIAGEVNGVLLAELNTRALFRNLDNIRSAAGGHIYVTDKTGKLIFHQDPSLVLRQTDRSALRVVSGILSHTGTEIVRDDDFYTYENEQGEAVLAAGDLIDETGWAVIFEEPKTVVMEPIRKIQGFAVAIVFLSIIVLLLLKKLNTQIVRSRQAVEIALERTKRLAEEQSAVVALGQKTLENVPLDTIFSEAVSRVASALGTEYVKVLELLPDGKQLILRTGVGWKAGYVGHVTVGAGAESQAGFTLLAKKPVVVEDTAVETRFSPPPLLKEHGVVSGMSIIIQGYEGRPFGVLGAHTAVKRSFTEEDINFVQSVANVLGDAISKDRNERIIYEHMQEVEKMNKLMVDRELKMIELKQKIKELEKKGVTDNIPVRKPLA